MLFHLKVILLAACAVVAAASAYDTASKTDSLRKLHLKESHSAIMRTGAVGGRGGFQEGGVRAGEGNRERKQPRNKTSKPRVKPRDDDENLSSAVPNLSFSLDFDEDTDDLPCSTGCEGDYDEFEAFWDQEQEQDLTHHAFFTVNGKYAVVYGEIYGKFTERLRELKRDHPEVHTLITYYMPGSGNDVDMTSAGILAYELKYNTCIPSNGDVFSGGTDFFVSGYNKYAAEGASIGIHSWSDGDTEAKDLPKDHPGHKMYLDHYDKVCVPQSFYWKTLETPYDGKHLITENEIINDFPWMRNCDSQCSLGTGDSEPCEDDTDWMDVEDWSCADYEEKDECDDEGEFAVNGVSANDVCCYCK